jgi:hypothetical protein
VTPYQTRPPNDRDKSATKDRETDEEELQRIYNNTRLGTQELSSREILL